MKIDREPVDKKFKDLVHYICARGGSHSRFGATILNKTLWFTDCASFLETGNSVTGRRYIKKQFGPVPAQINKTLAELESEQKLSISESDCFGYTKRDFVSRREPDMALLSKTEIDLVHRVLEYICENHSATSISEETHDIIWGAAVMGEEIPLEAILASKFGEITETHMAWANGVIEARA